MPKYVAFLRAINVGGHIVKMDHLRELFASLGFSNVETFIASGNVIFDSKSANSTTLEQKIERQLLKSLRYEVVTFIRTVSEVADVAVHDPFSTGNLKDEIAGVYVGFLKQSPDAAAKQKLLALSGEDDAFGIHKREAYWQRCGNFSDSKYSGAFLEKTLGQPATFRNRNTVQRLAAKYNSR